MTTPQFGRIPYWIVRSGVAAKLSRVEQAVLFGLCAHLNGRGDATTVATTTIASSMGLNTGTVRRALRGLEKVKVIETDHRPGFTSTYRVLGAADSQLDLFGTPRAGAPPHEAEPRAQALLTPRAGALTPRAGARTQEEKKSKKQNKKKKTPPPPFDKLDPSVDSPGVRSAITDWIVYRKQRKPALTEMTIDRLPRRILKMGADQFVAAVAHTIDQGWQGLREPDERAFGDKAQSGTMAGTIRIHEEQLAYERSLR